MSWGKGCVFIEEKKYCQMTSVVHPDPYWKCGPEGKNLPIKIEKSEEISCFEVLEVPFEGWRLLLKLERPSWRPRDKKLANFDQ